MSMSLRTLITFIIMNQPIGSMRELVTFTKDVLDTNTADMPWSENNLIIIGTNPSIFCENQKEYLFEMI